MKKLFASFFLSYLRTLSKIQLKKTNPLIIGVGGSSGKSSVSELISIALKNNFKVRESRGKNSETGIPLSILGIAPKDYDFLSWAIVAVKALFKALTDFEKYDVFVAEMGIDGPKEPKNMSHLLKIIKPKIAVLTNISYEHSVYFEDSESNAKEVLEKIIEQESLLIKSLDPDGVAIVNIDDKNIERSLKDVKAKVIRVSTLDKNVVFFAKNIEVSLNKFELILVYKEKEYKLRINQLLPKFYTHSFLLSIAGAVEAGVGFNEAISEIEDNFTLPPGRSSVFKGIKNTTIVDSSYNNATVEPILGILDLFNEIAKGRKIAIIGDMREQGKQSKLLHETLARKILETLDTAILVGPMLSEYAVPILKKSSLNFKSFQTFSEAKDAILSEVKEGDLILVKGSQNRLLLERVVELLLEDKKDIEKLCRRGSFWDKQRATTP